MSTFRIQSDATDFGTFEGETPAHALAAMHRAAGYASTVVDGEVIPPASAVDADGVSLCPSMDAVRITAARFVVVDASDCLAHDLGDQGRGEDLGWDTEDAAEAALENLAETCGWDVSDYSVRAATAAEIHAASQRV